jgi:hypothetical protein
MSVAVVRHTVFVVETSALGETDSDDESTTTLVTL